MIMNLTITIRSASRNYTPSIAFLSSRPSLGRSNTGGGIPRVDLRKFCGTQTGRREEDADDPNMDKVNNNNEKDDGENLAMKAGDAMEHSFGEGYATRSDEEGFGGVYARNDSYKLRKSGEIDEDHPEYDKSQGSEVKEKEKARFQKNTSS